MFDVTLASLDLLSSPATCGWCCGAPLPSTPPQDTIVADSSVLLHFRNLDLRTTLRLRHLVTFTSLTG